ncbi:Receptor-like kinase [Quillaja saponaria]|uniref:Receptor-like kinase n=1 Tax=Quillaja saponaria TaxID=32244 RepID=A0AAD7PXS1_QUISA|nr:Receptor-like kinase [Quillaja saponaria]
MFQLTAIFYLFFFLHLTTALYSYNATDLFFIICGTTGNYTADDRTWIGDKTLLPPIENPDRPSITLEASQSSSSIQVPYTIARLSYSEFTYTFPVTDGQKFVRLYFNTVSYPNFSRSNALFSVKSGPYTLLKDFNASLTADSDADADRSVTIFNEYCINVDQGQKLNLTFIPSKTNPDAYAFINGIEIVSMPTQLYYTKPDHPEGAVFINQNSQYPVGLEAALQMEYRINVGGSPIPSDRDTTGMFRPWVDDNDYVKVQRPASLPANWGATLKWNEQTPNYTAPDPVYLTARSYGMNETEKYNVTWEFPVDSGFLYLVRLHFCEFEPQIQQIGDRVFQIFIADGLAEDRADVILWSGGNLVPVSKDYVVRMSTATGSSTKKLNLTIKMQPHPNERIRKSNDVILNGVEIFKLSDPGSRNLAGPNPDPLPSTQILPVPSNKSKNNKKTTVVGVIAGVVSGVVLLSIFVVALLMFRRSRRTKVKAITKEKSSTDETSWAATNNFEDIFIIGIGGFGNVYKGYIDDGTTPVAIKRLKPGSQQGAHEFRTEIEMLSQLRHLHLVSLIGYCNDSNEMILVYDYMKHGTVRDHLYNTDNPALTWKERLHISIGAARGLHYLHTGARHTIIHRDVKTTNILLDEKWVAKVSDFGLSKIGPTGMSKAHVSTVVKGSIGYLDPEYYRRQRLTEKSDVYSFGVVLFEILCARPPLIRTAEKKQVSLAEWARQCYHKGTLYQIIDNNLKGKIAPECLNKFGEIAVNCLLDDGTQRPSMNDVVWGLEFALQLQENAEEEGMNVIEWGMERGKEGWTEESDDVFSSSIGQVSDFKSSSSGEKFSRTSTDRLLISKNVFSELLDPQGR